MKDIFVIDENGHIIWEDYRLEEDDYELEENEVDIKPPSFYRVKWDGEQWVEDGEPPEPVELPMSQTQAVSMLLAKSLGAEVEITPEVMSIAVADVPIIGLSDAEEWRPGVKVEAGIKCVCGGKAYVCIQAHLTQSDWSPDKTPALWKLQQEDYEKWKQPLGSHDAYQKDAKVTHKSKRWISTADNNVWEPGVYGWTEQK